MIEYFPGGRDLIPPLLTGLEAARLLRLDVAVDADGVESPRAPADALRSLRRVDGLRPHKFAKSSTYSRSDLLRLINTHPCTETDDDDLRT